MRERLGIIDDDQEVLDHFIKTYLDLGLSVYAFKYPERLDAFMSCCQTCDIILIDHRLGGSNGANVATKLAKDRKVKAQIFLFSDAVKPEYVDSFKFYFSRDDLYKNPKKILSVKKDFVEFAVEASVLMQLSVG